MTSIKELRRNITSLHQLHTITKAVEAVSVTKMKRSKDRAVANAAYFGSLLRITTHYIDAFSHYLLEKEEEENDAPACMLLVTSDKGLVGNLNAATLRTAEHFIDQHTDAVALCIGKKGYDYLQKRGHPVSFHVTNVSDRVVPEDLEHVADHLTTLHREKKIGSAHIVFQHFVSTFVQTPTVLHVLPLNQDHVINTLKTTVFQPAAKTAHDDDTAIQYTVEPDMHTLFDHLFDLLIKVSVYSALVENKVSEHASRMVAMKNARDTSEELLQEKNRELNKYRQAAVTREVLETLGSMEALGV